MSLDFPALYIVPLITRSLSVLPYQPISLLTDSVTLWPNANSTPTPPLRPPSATCNTVEATPHWRPKKSTSTSRPAPFTRTSSPSHPTTLPASTLTTKTHRTLLSCRPQCHGMFRCVFSLLGWGNIFNE